MSPREERFVVEGGHTLSGTIRASGNKNEALPVLSACLMTQQPVVLRDMPLIGDVAVMADMLRGMGVRIERNTAEPHTWTVIASTVAQEEMDEAMFSKLRASLTLAAPLLHRCGRAILPIPGGDKIGKRRVDTHLLALQEMGVQVREQEKAYELACPNGMHGADILLDEASVTGTENIVMAAVCARGTTTIYNAACEPHVQQLCRLLNAMGARIEGIGANRLVIEGVPQLGGATHAIEPDYIEVGSFIGLAAATKSAITIPGVPRHTVLMTLKAFAKLGIQTEWRGNDLHVPADQPRAILNDFRGAIPKIESAPWPGVPADLISIILVAATQCAGTILIHEKLFESRLFFIDRLAGMGARVVLCDPHRAVVIGPSSLQAGHLTSPDIRAGVAMLIAAMCASGTSVIDNIYMIDRGYERIDDRLNALGAKISRVAE